MLVTAQEFGTYGRLLRLLIYGGQRLAQIVALTDTHIDRSAKTFTWSREEMKSDAPHIVPYHDLTAALLEELPIIGYLFHGDDPSKPFSHFSGSHRAFLQACGVAHFTRHDCRRVYSSIHASIGTPPHLVERLLAHKNGSESGGPVAKIYNRYRYEKECRQACEAYEAYLVELIASP